MTINLTPREAAFVARSDVRAVQRAVDGGDVRGRVREVRGRSQRVLGRSEVRFFSALHGQEDTLTPAGRRELYRALQRPRSGKAALGSFVVDVDRVDRHIEQRIAELRRIKGHVQAGGEGDPVLKGTSVPVHLVAALAQSEGAEGAARAYPSLSRQSVDAAVAYAQIYPKKGRPYPSKSLKRMLSELALPDDVFGDAADGGVAREVTL